ncbi:MAG: SDR family NAD(P)-dependent oxidoreductase [Clostridia bacterium]|nr:SDR family NAD(P)-dependent oxidoreductase [Clostridia bacterium]
MDNLPTQNALEGVAIIGMSGRFPGARNIREFWNNLKNGVESISYFSKDDARACGIDEESLNNPDYVFAGGILDDIDMFDAGFFGFNPREAENMDPQHRLFLECSYEALEDAGYSRNDYDYPVGVYAGSNMSYYFLYHLLNKLGVKDDLAIAIGNDKDYLATRTSYEFNFKGPSINVQSACSTSMTAIAMAYEGLLNYHCDMALAGGSGIKLPQKSGYLYQTGMIGSPDGHTRPFDSNAYGTIFTSAVGVILMKRVEDAIRDGDHIYAVIRGMSVNNDGSTKVGFTAPSREGQAEVIAAAQNLAGVNPEDISYIEAHGTGTSLGDPIEISALTQVFNQSTQKKGFCAIGSVKSNIGHAISGAGVAGMIKTALALEHKEIPPSINFDLPNPKIDFENSAFYVNTKLTDWKSTGKPRIAGVSSFGFGGTNVHAVLEEAPDSKSSAPSRQWQLITLSARTPAALDKMCDNLASFFKDNPNVNFADAVYTLHIGRKEFEHRRAIVCKNKEDAVRLLELKEGQYIFSGISENVDSEYSETSKIIGEKNANEEVMLTALAKLWVEGSAIDWEEFHEGEQRLRIPLPTYPFERKKYWVEQYNMTEFVNKKNQVSTINTDFNNWLYLPSWKRAASLSFDSKNVNKKGCWIVFEDETGMGARIAKTLREENIYVITVGKAEGFRKINDTTFVLNPEKKADYRALFHEVSDSDKPLRNIVHLWNVTGDSNVYSRIEASKRCQIDGFYSLMYIAQALGELELDENVRLAAVTNNMHVISSEQTVHPEKAVVLGPCKVIPREYTKISCQSIDIVLPKTADAEEKLIGLILAELTSKDPEFIIALRGTHRWLQTHESITLEADNDRSFVREGKTYLITGGMGGIGLALAGYMAEKAKVNLVLTRRSFFPEKENWEEWLSSHGADDKTSIKIKQLKAIEALGSQIMVVNADSSNLEQMRKVIAKADEKFGNIDGVLHAAGIADNGLIQEKSDETAAKVLTPKVEGTLVLDELFKDRRLDILVLFSSSSAILGNAGFIDYCAANNFLDAFAHYKNSCSDTSTVAINWDEWDEVGMAAESKSRDRVKNKITVKEGLNLLDRIVSSKASAQVIVSSGDFTGMLENIRNYLKATAAGKAVVNQDKEKGSNRPELQTPYEAPRNGTEEVIAEMWQNLLGVYPVGINDDFFDLGGHSLLATSLISELAKEFKKNITLQSLFERATVAQLAELFDGDSEESAKAEEEDSEEGFEEGEF